MGTMNKVTSEAVAQVIAFADKAKTMEDLQQLLHGITYAVGGMVCHFDKEDRSSVLIGLTQALGMGLQTTAKQIGEPSDIEIVMGGRK